MSGMKLLGIYIICMMLIIQPIILLSQQGTDVVNKYQLRIGITKTYSLNTNQQDLIAAFKLWTNLYSKKLHESHNIEIDAQFTLYKNLELLETDINENKIDLLSLPIQEYSKLTGAERFEPTLTGNTTENKFTQFVLLVHKNSNLEAIEDLEGKDINMPEAGFSELMKIWMQVELYKNELPNFDNFSHNILTTEKENTAIYSVFFNQIDCALVRKSTFDIANELNPQIKSNLRVILISPKFVANLTAIRKDYDPKIKELIVDVTTKFHLNPEDRQILSLFKFSRMHELNENDMAKVNKLFSEYRNYNMLTLDKK